ncbi:MAG: helix-turn-helix domain-containing protein, partial [Rikenellaceae bacterium]
FRKFASEIAAQCRMPAIVLDPQAREILKNYHWRGNIRQLKNVAEQISAIEEVRDISPEILMRYLPEQEPMTVSVVGGSSSSQSSSDNFSTERELLYKVLFDMRSDMNELKRMLQELMHKSAGDPMASASIPQPIGLLPSSTPAYVAPQVDYAESEVVAEEYRELTKADVQREQIRKALQRHNGRRREAAADLFMSERTLYRKIKELGIDED